VQKCMKKGSLKNIILITIDSFLNIFFFRDLTLPDPTDPTIINNLFPLISTLMSSRVVLSFVQLTHAKRYLDFS
jgi:hypothetical protein